MWVASGVSRRNARARASRCRSAAAAPPSRGSAPATCGCAARTLPGSPRSTNSVSNIAARRVVRRHVERLEVVPVGLDLGALGHGEAEPDEDVLEALPGLGHEVEVAPTGRWASSDLGEVESFGLQPTWRCSAAKARRRSARARSRCDAGLHRRRAHHRALVGGSDAEPAVELSEGRLLAGQVEALGPPVVEGGDRAPPGRAPLEGGGNFVDHDRSFPEPWRGGAPGPDQVRGGVLDAPRPRAAARGRRNRRDSLASRTSAGTLTRLLAGRLEAQHGGRHRHVQALGPTDVRDASPSPSMARARPAGPWASLPSTSAHGRSSGGLVVGTRRRCATAPRRRTPRLAQRAEGHVRHDRHVEQRAGRGPHRLGVERRRPSPRSAPRRRRRRPRPSAGSCRRCRGRPVRRRPRRSRLSAPPSAGARRCAGDHGQHRLGRHGGGDPLEHTGRQLVHRRATAVDAAAAPGRDEHRLDRRPGGEGLGEQRGALDDEGALVLTRSCGARGGAAAAGPAGW